MLKFCRKILLYVYNDQMHSCPDSGFSIVIPRLFFLYIFLPFMMSVSVVLQTSSCILPFYQISKIFMKYKSTYLSPQKILLLESRSSQMNRLLLLPGTNTHTKNTAATRGLYPGCLAASLRKGGSLLTVTGAVTLPRSFSSSCIRILYPRTQILHLLTLNQQKYKTAPSPLLFPYLLLFKTFPSQKR